MLVIFSGKRFLISISTWSLILYCVTVGRVTGLALWIRNYMLLKVTFLLGLPLTTIIGDGKWVWLHRGSVTLA